MDDALRKQIFEAIRKRTRKETEIVRRQIEKLRENTNRLEAAMKSFRKTPSR